MSDSLLVLFVCILAVTIAMMIYVNLESDLECSRKGGVQVKGTISMVCMDKKALL